MGNGQNDETTVELLSDTGAGSITHGDSICLGFGVSSIEEMLETVKSRGIAILNGPFETPAFKFFTIKDPEWG